MAQCEVEHDWRKCWRSACDRHHDCIEKLKCEPAPKGWEPSPYCTCNGDDSADEEELFSNRCKACGGQLV